MDLCLLSTQATLTTFIIMGNFFFLIFGFAFIFFKEEKGKAKEQ